MNFVHLNKVQSVGRQNFRSILFFFYLNKKIQKVNFGQDYFNKI